MARISVAWGVVTLSGLAAVSFILASILGSDFILLSIFTGIFTVAAARMVFKLQTRQRHKQVADRERCQKKELLERQKQEELERQRVLTLDSDCADLLRKARVAVDVILASFVYVHDLSNPRINKELLEDNVITIFDTGRAITDLRAEINFIIVESSSDRARRRGLHCT